MLPSISRSQRFLLVQWICPFTTSSQGAHKSLPRYKWWVCYFTLAGINTSTTSFSHWFPLQSQGLYDTKLCPNWWILALEHPKVCRVCQGAVYSSISFEIWWWKEFKRATTCHHQFQMDKALKNSLQPFPDLHPQIGSAFGVFHLPPAFLQHSSPLNNS